MSLFAEGCLRDLRAFLERFLEQKSRNFWRDPKCFRTDVGSFPLTFGVIWSSLRHILAQLVHCLKEWQYGGISRMLMWFPRPPFESDSSTHSIFVLIQKGGRGARVIMCTQMRISGCLSKGVRAGARVIKCTQMRISGCPDYFANTGRILWYC